MITLVIVLVVLFAGLFFFSGTVAKVILESQLTSSNGAEVNISAVEVSYLPLSIEINKIEMTDKDKPELNFIEIKKAIFELNTSSLFKGNFIINEMAVDKIEFSTARKNPGKVNIEEQAEDKDSNEAGSASDDESFSMSSLELPDIDELLNKADLETPKVFKAVEDKTDATEQSWKV
ncbi:MAG: AsmA family protein, partial [Gammaproteobacteria bacterium]|nr:AsmA family protein [Gammaproteobacteria bacterium]